MTIPAAGIPAQNIPTGKAVAEKPKRTRKKAEAPVEVVEPVAAEETIPSEE